MIETLTTYPFFMKKIECFQLTNLTITLLSCPLLFLESGRDRSSGFISTPESLQLLITVFSRSLSEMLFGMRDISTSYLNVLYYHFGVSYSLTQFGSYFL